MKKGRSSSENMPPRFKRSFYRAFIGLGIGFEDPMLKRHIASTIGAISCAIYYRLDSVEMAVVLLCCSLVIGLELLNTAFERIADELKNPRPSLDVAAASVLIVSLFSLVIGFMFFLPKAAASSPWFLLMIMVLTPISWMVIK